jgi:hypothetical protein
MYRNTHRQSATAVYHGSLTILLPSLCIITRELSCADRQTISCYYNNITDQTPFSDVKADIVRQIRAIHVFLSAFKLSDTTRHGPLIY